MSDWLTYSISDFLLFSPEVYWRLVTNYLAELGLLPAIIALSYPVLTYCLSRQKQLKLVLLYFVLLWGWLGWQFYFNQYLSINWFAKQLGYACLLQGLLLFVASWQRTHYHSSTKTRYYLTAIAVSLLLMPMLAITNNLPWSVAVIGLMPLPSAIITLLLLSLITSKWRLVLMPIPLLLLLVELLTLDQLSWQLFNRY